MIGEPVMCCLQAELLLFWETSIFALNILTWSHKSIIYWFKCQLPLRKYVLRSACQRSTIWKKMYNSMEYVTMCLRNWISMLPVPYLWPWKGKPDWHFFSPFNHSQCFSARRLLLQNARGWVVYKPRYLSQFWRLEVQDQGASMVAWVRASVRTNP